MPLLEFARQHDYSSSSSGITVPVRLYNGRARIDLIGHIDTGASNCIFQREYGELIDLRIEEGTPTTFLTAIGAVPTFGHMVSIEVFGLAVESMAYFFADAGIQKNLLGRVGWLDRMRLGVVDYDRLLYLAPYDWGGR